MQYNAKREAALKNASFSKPVSPAARLKKRRKTKGKKSKKVAKGKSMTQEVATPALVVDSQGNKTHTVGETNQLAESSTETSRQSNPSARSSIAAIGADLVSRSEVSGRPPPTGTIAVTVRSGANLVHLEMSKLQAFAVVFAVLFVFRRADDFVVAFGLRILGWLLGWPNAPPQ